MPRSDIFHPEFQPRPYWWEAYELTSGELADVPKEARVAIVGGGYAGLAAALELAKQGVDAVVLERGRPGTIVPPIDWVGAPASHSRGILYHAKVTPTRPPTSP